MISMIRSDKTKIFKTAKYAEDRLACKSQNVEKMPGFDPSKPEEIKKGLQQLLAFVYLSSRDNSLLMARRLSSRSRTISIPSNHSSNLCFKTQSLRQCGQEKVNSGQRKSKFETRLVYWRNPKPLLNWDVSATNVANQVTIGMAYHKSERTPRKHLHVQRGRDASFLVHLTLTGPLLKFKCSSFKRLNEELGSSWLSCQSSTSIHFKRALVTDIGSEKKCCI